MISLIICSRNPNISPVLKDNIGKTIGVDYELIIIDNSENKYSIFQAYNEGVKRSCYPYLCFMHEDILYHTQNWGKRVLEHFEDEKIGLFGVFGGHYLPDVATWAFTGVDSGNIIQGNRASSLLEDYSTYLTESDLFFEEGENKIQVVAVDGVWICLPKILFNDIRFDEHTFNGFHAYDLDISMQVNKAGYKVYVINDVMIEHFSLGNFDLNYISSINIFHKKWNDSLPIIKGIELTVIEQNLRREFALKNLDNRLEIDKLKLELVRIRHSKSYRIGRIILKPLFLLKGLFA